MDVPDIQFRFWLARYLAIFYYPTPDMATMLNDTRYRNRIFYLLILINILISLDSDVKPTVCLSVKQH